MNKLAKALPFVALCALLPSVALAAGTTAVEAGFADLGDDLETLLNGAGGFVILIISVIIAGVTVAFTGRWGTAAVAFGVAVFLGYGVDMLSGFAGVSASTDMVELSVLQDDGPMMH